MEIRMRDCREQRLPNQQLLNYQITQLLNSPPLVLEHQTQHVESGLRRLEFDLLAGADKLKRADLNVLLQADGDRDRSHRLLWRPAIRSGDACDTHRSRRFRSVLRALRHRSS